MDIGRAVYLLAQTYVIALVALSVVTLAWVFDVFEQTDVRLAGIWFALSGFGFLVLMTFLLVHFTRD